jgi:hypothetical protein
MTTKGQGLEARLKKRLDKQTTAHRSRQKANYELAKQLGFEPREAAILQNWKEEDIRALASERGYSGGDE